MEHNGLVIDSEWPAASLPLRMRGDALMAFPGSGEGTTFTVDEFGNVLLPDQETYTRYEAYLSRQEAQDVRDFEAA